MNLSSAQIEDIVRVVVQRLQTNAAAPEVQTTAEPNSTAAIEAVAGEVRLDNRVITLDSLSGQLSGVRELVVHPKAVVTPAVKDELRQRGIRLVRRLPTAKSSANRSAPLLLVTDASHHAALSRAVCSQQATAVAAKALQAASLNSSRTLAIQNAAQCGARTHHSPLWLPRLVTRDSAHCSCQRFAICRSLWQRRSPT